MLAARPIVGNPHALTVVSRGGQMGPQSCWRRLSTFGRGVSDDNYRATVPEMTVSMTESSPRIPTSFLTKDIAGAYGFTDEFRHEVCIRFQKDVEVDPDTHSTSSRDREPCACRFQRASQVYSSDYNPGHMSTGSTV